MTERTDLEQSGKQGSTGGETSFRDGHSLQSCGGLRMRGKVRRSETATLITIITVTFNVENELEETILSVAGQTYPNIEYIIIDGASSDKTVGIIKRHETSIDYWVSEPDGGIYDAMNKGVALSTGDWLLFLNAKDTFVGTTTISDLIERYVSKRASDKCFFYSDVYLAHSAARDKLLIRHVCDHGRRIIIHQAALYAKILHDRHGLYLVAKGVTISDYLFFSLIPQTAFAKVEDPIAIYDVSGVSQSKRAVEQKFIIDYLINGLPKFKFLPYFLFYFYYRQLKGLCIVLTHRLSRAFADVRQRTSRE
jgi:glycosyltransferase involved in cell wall biosynthesis